DAGYQQIQAVNNIKITSLDDELKTISEKIKAEEQVFTNYFNDGFLTQIQALNNLISNNSALRYRYYLLVIILLLIELMPVIAKTLLPAGTYDEKVLLREDLEKEIAHDNIRKEKELKELYNTLAGQNDKEAITAFFDLTKQDRTEKITAFSKSWKEDKRQTFDGLWEKMKKEILTKQEN
ncbi:MAG: DUF4407 domain-containing protein, partial [Ferruginibacter sp.]